MAEIVRANVEHGGAAVAVIQRGELVLASLARTCHDSTRVCPALAELDWR